eukprot:TRINITY_DN481_c0_g1_i4.p1 TRINITY_DN481_c0_g1~~TRINITY_DN481_c0_g1_i4.p1  ORF type:complete len:347 (-),score=63.30 TRINITY_DN481_c0_g1_i4:79-1119(-)
MWIWTGEIHKLLFCGHVFFFSCISSFLAFPRGGLGHVEMLYRTNILALVGGGVVPAFPPNQVVLWDDHTASVLGQLKFREPVLAVKLSRERVVVVLRSVLFVYGLDSLEEQGQFTTAENPLGVVSLSETHGVLACLALQEGHIRLEKFDERRNLIFKAHKSPVRALTLNSDGSLLVSASEKGTVIRIFNTHSDCTAPVQELRRGAQPANIFSVNFSRESEFLCVCSDKGTVHVFGLREAVMSLAEGAAEEGDEKESGPKNPRSKFAFAGKFLPKYFQSEWSFAHFKGPDVPCICCFGNRMNTIVFLNSNGDYYELAFDPEKGGECKAASFHKFHQLEDSPAKDILA